MRFLRFATLATLSVFLALPAAAAGWTTASQRAIALDAARLAPPDLYRQLRRNRESFMIGVEEPGKTGATVRVDAGRLEALATKAIDDAIGAIQGHRPFNEVAYRLGLVAHYFTALNDPLSCDDSDPQEPRFADDFRRYVESAAPRQKRVFYGFRPGAERDRGRAVVAEALARGRRFYPMIGREYRRVDFRAGVQAFDDRSTAFAVAALGYSHAVSDVADALRLVWLAAGGVDSRTQLPIRGRQVLHLPAVSDAP